MTKAVMEAAQAETIAGNGAGPAQPHPDMDEADAFIVERIAEAVIRKIDERDKINLLAEAVITRLQTLRQGPAGGESEAQQPGTEKEGEV